MERIRDVINALISMKNPNDNALFIDTREEVVRTAYYTGCLEVDEDITIKYQLYLYNQLQNALKSKYPKCVSEVIGVLPEIDKGYDVTEGNTITGKMLSLSEMEEYTSISELIKIHKYSFEEDTIYKVCAVAYWMGREKIAEHQIGQYNAYFEQQQMRACCCRYRNAIKKIIGPIPNIFLTSYMNGIVDEFADDLTDLFLKKYF